MSNRIKKRNVKSNRRDGINPAVAELPDIDDVGRFSIGFRYFKDNLCVLKDVDPKVSRKVHEIYRNLGRCSSILEARKLPHDVKTIVNCNDYTKYYNGLTEDVELYEFDAGECRGFFFFDSLNKIIHMIAIDHHPDYKKNRR